MHPKHIALPVLAALLLLSTAACQEQQAQPMGGGGPGAPGAVGVTVTTVEPRDLPLAAELSGRAAPYRVAEVRPQVSGIVLKRLFEEGGAVEAGQQLYQIDPATYQAAAQSAEADLAKARANLKSVEAKAARYADLVKINAVSRQDYDDVVATLDQARAQILVAQAAVQTARINLDFTKVYAPIAGRIGKSSVTEGALVTANQTSAMATITQLDPIFVDLNQSSAELAHMRRLAAAAGNAPDAPAVVRLLSDDGGVQPAAGQLKFTDVTVDPSTGMVQLRAEFANPRHELLPGQFVRARVEQGTLKQALLIPQPALIRNADGSTIVWVVGADNTVQPRPVQVGGAVGGEWRVDGGLNPGERVVVTGLQKIQPGAPVAPTPAAKTDVATRP